MAERPRFLPLFAKAGLIVGLFFPIVFAVLYPARKAEREAYSAAPLCATGVTDTSNCRLMTDAEVVKADCPSQHQNLDACTLELRVAGARKFLPLPRETSQRLNAGAHLRIELFKGIPTSAEVDGKIIARAGSADDAMSTLRYALVVSGVLVLLCGMYLWRNRRGATS